MAIAEKEIIGTKLPLDSLEIKGYRAFDELTIPKLARVNLITGKNNVGKSSLLEAVYLYARRATPEAVWQVLSERQPAIRDVEKLGMSELLMVVARMFNGVSQAVLSAGKSDLTASFSQPSKVLPLTHSISIGDAATGKNMAAPAASVTITIVWPEPEKDLPVGLRTLSRDTPHGHSDNELLYSLGRIIYPDRATWKIDGALQAEYVGPRGLHPTSRGRLWDELDLTPRKDLVIAGLRVVEPRIRDVALFGDTGFGLGRVPHIGIESDALKHPLSQFGDGMNRLFDILIALANVPGGILILDEVENGLHYSILTDVWKTIFNLAKQLNVQVFATTHSWECIVAFQTAAEGDMQDEVLLIRLRDKNGRVVATDFDAEDLDVITRGLIEVR